MIWDESNIISANDLRSFSRREYHWSVINKIMPGNGGDNWLSWLANTTLSASSLSPGFRSVRLILRIDFQNETCKCRRQGEELFDIVRRDGSGGCIYDRVLGCPRIDIITGCHELSSACRKVYSKISRGNQRERMIKYVCELTEYGGACFSNYVINTTTCR